MSGNNTYQGGNLAACFEQRLERAISRGERAGRARRRADVEKADAEQELRQLHTRYRLELGNYVEDCLKRISEQLPGFQMALVASERGWGAAVSRKDLDLAHRPTARFSRLEMLFRPLTQVYVLELTVKATIGNREFFNRDFYQPLESADASDFRKKIDLWALEFAELYARRS